MAERKAVQTLQRLAALAQDDRPPPRSDVIPRAAQGRERLQFLIAAISGNWRLLARAGEAATTHIEAPCYGFSGGFCVAPHGEEVKGALSVRFKCALSLGRVPNCLKLPRAQTGRTDHDGRQLRWTGQTTTLDDGGAELVLEASGGDELLAQAMTTVNGKCDRLRDANPASVTEPAVGRGARNRS